MTDHSLSHLSFGNLKAIEALQEQYRLNPEQVDPSWRYFFEGMAFAGGQASNPTDIQVYQLINAYRQWGHLIAASNPLAASKPSMPPELKLETFGFQESDLHRVYPTQGFLTEKEAPLKTLIEALQATYCGSIGIEYMHTESLSMQQWLQQRLEPPRKQPLSPSEEVDILHQLTQAELFEQFIHMRYPGQKRFSLEGAETLIPLLKAILEECSQNNISECILGMAHRGRLNVLTHILQKPYGLLFREFEATPPPQPHEGTGDVKYHKGFSNDVTSQQGKKLSLTLMANPSHLESVDPVTEGFCRGKQTLESPALPLLIHGDAALAGQGVVYETLQLSRLSGYSTGGTLHIIINNQIGFTTVPTDARSTPYCTSIAKAFSAPVFHVNAEDPINAVIVAKLALQLRQQFGCDVFIDLNGYRKYGHNEGDEPTFTQPLEYASIRARPSIRTLFKAKLTQDKKITDAAMTQFEEQLKASFTQPLPPPSPSLIPSLPPSPVHTAVEEPALRELIQRLCDIPADFHLHPKVNKLLQERAAMLDKGFDWGMGENLAYASLLIEGIPIRLSGQDVGRGTFSHRHAIWVDQTSGPSYSPLEHLKPGQARFDVFNSPLSEFAVLGFDFGYSVAHPKTLVIWEAQFGDFSNGAQIIIDQYIASAEQKWGWHSSLTLLLPHGYEGQGPEHSSARIERFLQLAGHDNMRIANATTPAQLFHLLRSQALNPIQKPLILFTPKVLLRHPQCLSPLCDFTQGAFQPVLDDPSPPVQPKKILLCSGKIYYDLSQERTQRKDTSCVLIRLEQLYPFPQQEVESLLKKYSAPVAWIQEEPQNMGPWEYIHAHCQAITYIGRETSASPATGSSALHLQQVEQIMKQAFEG